MFAKYIKSRNYKKGKHDVVIRLNNFSSDNQKEDVIWEIKQLMNRINYTSESKINYKIKIGWT